MGEFYRRYAPYLSAVCRRYIAENEEVKDVLQDCFVKMFTSICRFRSKEDGSLKAWATRIVVNDSLNLLRAKRKMVFVEERMADGIPDSEMQIHSFSPEQLQHCIEQLPTGYRTVFNLFAAEIMSGSRSKRLPEMLVNMSPRC